MLRSVIRRYSLIVLLGPPVTLLYFLCFIQESREGVFNDPDPSQEPSSLIDLSSRSQDFFKDQEGRNTHYPHSYVRIIRQEFRHQEEAYFDSKFNPKFKRRKPFSQTSIGSNRLLSMHNFQFLMNCSTACSSPPFLVAFVHSAPANFVKRKVIRETWASKSVTEKLNVRVLFILGISDDNDTKTSIKIHQESRTHNDLVQGNFVDSYRNLTLKHVAGLRWVSRFCNESKFVMKADDDAFVDMFLVVKILKKMQDYQDITTPLKQSFYHQTQTSLLESDQVVHQKSIKTNSNPGILACSLFPDGSTVRRTGKWALSQQEYPLETFPAYCSGIGYFTTPNIAGKLFEAAHLPGLRLLWIDDVFVTGILPSILGIKQHSFRLKYSYNEEKLRRWANNYEKQEGKENLKSNRFLVSDIGKAYDWSQLMYKLWEKTLREEDMPPE